MEAWKNKWYREGYRKSWVGKLNLSAQRFLRPLLLLTRSPKTCLLGWGLLASAGLKPGPISLQVQISYHSSREPLPLAYAVLYLTCVGKLGALLGPQPRAGWGVVGNDAE